MQVDKWYKRVVINNTVVQCRLSNAAVILGGLYLYVVGRCVVDAALSCMRAMSPRLSSGD